MSSFGKTHLVLVYPIHIKKGNYISVTALKNHVHIKHNAILKIII